MDSNLDLEESVEKMMSQMLSAETLSEPVKQVDVLSRQAWRLINYAFP
jgi:hypothetical protein